MNLKSIQNLDPEEPLQIHFNDLAKNTVTIGFIFIDLIPYLLRLAMQEQNMNLNDERRSSW